MGSDLFPGFRSERLDCGGITLHCRVGGEGPPLLMLHGYPQTHHTWHRVAPGFVIQTGALAFRDKPLTITQQALVRDLPPEFSDTPNVPGIVSMARGEDPASGSTSFFICIGECRSLDGQYTVFARVASGMDVVERMVTVELDGEAPRTPIRVDRVRVLNQSVGEFAHSLTWSRTATGPGRPVRGSSTRRPRADAPVCGRPRSSRGGRPHGGRWRRRPASPGACRCA